MSPASGVPLSSRGGPSAELPPAEACLACGSLSSLLELLAAVCRCVSRVRDLDASPDVREAMRELAERAREIAP